MSGVHGTDGGSSSYSSYPNEEGKRFREDETPGEIEAGEKRHKVVKNKEPSLQVEKSAKVEETPKLKRAPKRHYKRRGPSVGKRSLEISVGVLKKD